MSLAKGSNAGEPAAPAAAPAAAAAAAAPAKEPGGGGGPVVRRGYLKKLKTNKKKYFVLRAESKDASARLDYYDTDKKFFSGNSPKRSILLKTCFNINKRTDTKHKHVIALYTKDDCFCVILENEADTDAWLKALQSLQHGDECVDGEPPRPYFGTFKSFTHLTHLDSVAEQEHEHIWHVQILTRGVGTNFVVRKKKNTDGVEEIVDDDGHYQFCLTDKTLSVVKESFSYPVATFALNCIRSCGCLKNYIYLELGRSSTVGAGELWLETEDANIANNIHSTVYHAMMNSNSKSNSKKDIQALPSEDEMQEMPPKARVRSCSATEASKPAATNSRRGTFIGASKPIAMAQDASASTSTQSIDLQDQNVAPLPQPSACSVNNFLASTQQAFRCVTRMATERRHSVSAGPGVLPGSISHQRTRSLPLSEAPLYAEPTSPLQFQQLPLHLHPQVNSQIHPQTHPLTNPQTHPLMNHQNHPQTHPLTNPQTHPLTNPQTHPLMNPQNHSLTNPQTQNHAQTSQQNYQQMNHQSTNQHPTNQHLHQQNHQQAHQPTYQQVYHQQQERLQQVPDQQQSSQHQQVPSQQTQLQHAAAQRAALLKQRSSMINQSSAKCFGGRERSDSMPSSGRNANESNHAHNHNMIWEKQKPYLMPLRPLSLYGKDISHSPPTGGSPVSPPSQSTDSAGSSLSIDEHEHEHHEHEPEPAWAEEIQPTLGRYSHSITPDEVIAEENGDDCPSSPVVTVNHGSSPRQPTNYVPMCGPVQSSDDGYVDMSPKGGRHTTASPAVSVSSITSGTPSTDMRFAEYQLEKVISYLGADDIDENSERPTRAYSVGSRPETYKHRTRLDTARSIETRDRAFSVGSKTKKGHNRVLPSHGHVHNGPKSSSAPILPTSRLQGSHSSIDPMDDLMEMDFSKPQPGSSGYLDMRPGSKGSTPQGYVDMRPGNLERNRHPEIRHPENRHLENRHAENRHPENRYSEGRHPESRLSEGRHSESRNSEGRHSESRNSESRNSESRNSESRNSESRHSESRYSDSRHSEGRHSESRHPESRHQDGRQVENGPYMDMRCGTSPIKPNFFIPLQSDHSFEQGPQGDYMDMDPGKRRNVAIYSQHPPTTSYMDMNFNKSRDAHLDTYSISPTKSSIPPKYPEGTSPMDYMDMDYSHSRDSTKSRTPTNEGYVEMTLGGKKSASNRSFDGSSASNRSFDGFAGDYTDMSVGSSKKKDQSKKSSKKESTTRSLPIQIQSTTSNQVPKNSSPSSPMYSMYYPRKYSTGTPPSKHLPLSSSPYSSLPRQGSRKNSRRDSKDSSSSSVTTPSSSSTIFPFSLNSPSSPIKPEPKSPEPSNIKVPPGVLSAKYKGSSSTPSREDYAPMNFGAPRVPPTGPSSDYMNYTPGANVSIPKAVCNDTAGDYALMKPGEYSAVKPVEYSRSRSGDETSRLSNSVENSVDFAVIPNISKDSDYAMMVPQKHPSKFLPPTRQDSGDDYAMMNPGGGLSSPMSDYAVMRPGATNLPSANLQTTNLHSTNLKGTNMQSTNLQTTNLQTTNLQTTNLHTTNLQTLQGNSRGKTHGTTDGIAQGTTHGITHGTTQGITQNTTHGITHGTTHGVTPQGANPHGTTPHTFTPHTTTQQTTNPRITNPPTTTSTNTIVTKVSAFNLSESGVNCFRPIMESREDRIPSPKVSKSDSTEAETPYYEMLVANAKQLPRPSSVNSEKIQARVGFELNRPSSVTSDTTRTVTSRPSSASSELGSSSSTLVGSRPESVNSDRIRPSSTNAEGQLHYASLDLTSTAEEESTRNPRTRLQAQSAGGPQSGGGQDGHGSLAGQQGCTYADIDFVKSEGLKQSSAQNSKVKH